MIKHVFPQKSTSRSMQWLLTIIALGSIIFTSACGGQSQPQETPTAAEQPSFAIEPEEPLPPALVEATPLPDSVIGQQQSIDLYFNQPMDHPSVEAALRMAPAVQRTLEWMDDSTLRITPQEDLPADSMLEINLGVTALASNGLGFQDPVSLTYHAPAMLIASEMVPSPESTEIDPSSAVMVNFNQPVVPLGADSASVEAAFTLSPQVEGHGEWLNTSTYIFYPDPALLGGVRYTVTLNTALVSTNGMGFADATGSSWSFTTALPMLVNLTPALDFDWIRLDQSFVMTFNQPMDAASFESNFSFVSASGEQVAGSYTWNETNSEVTFTPASLLARSTLYTLTIPTTVLGSGGTPIDRQTIAQYETVTNLGLVSTNPGTGEPLELYGGMGYFSLTFTSPLAQQDYEELVSISPAVSSFSVSASAEDTTIYIYAAFSPSSTYTLTVDGALRDTWGDTLGEPLIISLQTAASQPGISIFAADSGMGAMVLLPGEVTTPARAVNISSIDITSGPISVGEFISLSSYTTDRESFSPGDVSYWQVPLSLAQNADTSIEVPLTNMGQTLPTGLYYYRIYSTDAAAGQDYYSPTVFLAEVSRVHLVVKTSTTQLMIWAVDSITLEPLASTTFTVVDGNMSTIASGETDEQGVGIVDISARDDPWSQLFVQIGQPGDDIFSFASSAWNSGVSPWDFGLNFTYESTQPFIYMYSDRAIYQPGQTIYYRGIIRQPNNGRYSNTALRSIPLEIYGISNDPSMGYAQNESFSAEVSSWGTFSGEYVIPENAQPGSYYIQATGGLSAYLSFTVAEYRKPEIDLSVDFSSTGYIRGQDLQAQVDAQYYFGAPAGSQAFTWTLYASQGYFSIPGGYQTGTYSSAWWGYSSEMYYSDLGQFIISGEGSTNSNGTAQITIPSSDILAVLATENLYNMTLEVTIQDETGMPTSARGETQLHMADFYIGVRPDQWGGTAGEELGFSVLTTGWDTQSSPSHTLEATFSRVEWEQSGTDPYTMAPSYEPVYTTVGSTDFVTDADGHARLSFTPDQPGTYVLSVRGEGAVTEVLTWVGGIGSAVWPTLPDQQIELTADAGEYIPGDTANIFIPNPLGAGAVGLVSIERGEVMRYQTIQFTGSSYTLALDLSADDAPNIYVSVIILGQGSSGDTTFRIGYIQLLVDPVEEVLNIELTAQPAIAGPGDTVQFNILVTDDQGRPVSGEFSAALVDKAVLALMTPNATDITTAFYAPQPLGVNTGLMLAVYSNRFGDEAVRAEAPAGGLGGGGDGATTVREDFQDTAFWDGTIVTDGEGRAQFSVTLPDNLTTWVLTVRGLDEQTRVGEAELELVSTLPLLVRPVTPRFLVENDHVQIAAVVNNNTDVSRTVSVTLRALGFTLDDQTVRTQQVEVAANSQERVTWWGTVQNVEQVSMIFSANDADYHDSATPTWGALPVLQYSAPVLFSTSGMLSEGGERLEVVSLPSTYTPTGGELQVEMDPSLAASVLSGMQALQEQRYDYTEPILSRLLVETAIYQTMSGLRIDDAELQNNLASRINNDISAIIRMQSFTDGGWSWTGSDYQSDPYITAYVLLGLRQAVDAGFSFNEQSIASGQAFLQSNIVQADMSMEDGDLDRQAFYTYVLQLGGISTGYEKSLFDLRDRLSPWAQALLALTYNQSPDGQDEALTLMSDLEASASASATGIHWQSEHEGWYNWDSPTFTTAVVLYSLASMDPANELLGNAVRYLVANRGANGMWYSSYNTAWTLLAFLRYLEGTGELQAEFGFDASVNGVELAHGQTGPSGQGLTSVYATVPLDDLLPDSPNLLTIQRDNGVGRLYYRANLLLERPADEAEPVNRGLSITRQYVLDNQNCRSGECPAITSVQLGSPQAVVQARLTLVVPEDMYYVIVEDYIPAGVEIVNLSLETSQQGLGGSQYYPADPFSEGWGWWLFSNPQIYDDHLRWVVRYLPAGTYVLTYRMLPLQAGEYQVLPAHAFQYYFPEVEGTSAGAIFTINE